MKKILGIAMLWAISVSVAHAGIITVSNTTTGTSASPWTTDYSIEFNDADANLTLTMAELIGISWVSTNGASTLSGTSLPLSIGDGGIDFVVSAAAGLISASTGNYEFLAGPGRIGLQANPFLGPNISYYGTCNVSCGAVAPFSSFAVSLAPVSVPNPATLALFGLGLAGLGWSRRKKA